MTTESKYRQALEAIAEHVQACISDPDEATPQTTVALIDGVLGHLTYDVAPAPLTISVGQCERVRALICALGTPGGPGDNRTAVEIDGPGRNAYGVQNEGWLVIKYRNVSYTLTETGEVFS